jgi:membrane carboxypeptidase/penicillin-binding protein
LPDIDEIKNPPALSSKIYDRNGELLYKFYEDENRTWIPIKKIPLSLIWATIAIEDKKFLIIMVISQRDGAGSLVQYPQRYV